MIEKECRGAGAALMKCFVSDAFSAERQHKKAALYRIKRNRDMLKCAFRARSESALSLATSRRVAVSFGTGIGGSEAGIENH